MKIKELIEILKEQKSNLNSLLEIVKEKQEILITNKLKQLPDYIALEEKKLLTIQITEEKRLRVMQELFTEYNIKSERFKIEILIDALKQTVPGNLLVELKNKETEMKTLIKEVTKINQQNLLLVQQSSQIISETVKAVIETSNRSIIDRKG